MWHFEEDFYDVAGDYERIINYDWPNNYIKKLLPENHAHQRFIQASLMSDRQHKKLNLLSEFSNSIFKKNNIFKAYWSLTCTQNKLAY